MRFELFAEIREAVVSWTHALRREGSFLVDLRDFDGVRLEYHRQVGFAAGLGMTRDVGVGLAKQIIGCLLYTSPSPRDTR